VAITLNAEREGALAVLWNVSVEIAPTEAAAVRRAALASAIAAVRDGDTLQEPTLTPAIEIRVSPATFDASQAVLREPVDIPWNWANRNCGREWRFLHSPELDLSANQVSAVRAATAQALGMTHGTPIELRGGAGLGAGIFHVASLQEVLDVLSSPKGA
jgi:hypothetical protein